MDKTYLNLLEHVLEHGDYKADRTGTGTLSVFGPQMVFDLQEGFPLCTTKKTHFKSIVHELLWFIGGNTNNNLLEQHGVSIWREWAKYEGYLGPIYGKQWRRWEKIDLVQKQYFTPPTITLDSSKVAGVGYNTDARSNNQTTKQLYSVWSEMLHRCYNPSRKRYDDYGGRGIFVDESWHNFDTFLKDAFDLPNGLLKRAYPTEYELDKDYYATNKYSKDTCIWLTQKEQHINTRRGRICIARRPDGHEITTMDIAGLCKDYLLDPSTVYKCLRGERPQHKQWTFRQQELDDNVVPRTRFFDQIKELIANIKYNPDSRRHIVSAWNPVDVPNMALPPCHTLFQFYVSRNELSCKLYQRSADMFLGVPFNIASYALLTHLIAKECGYSVGKFIWTAGDAHIYANHIDAVRTQLTRKPFKLPKLEIRDDVSFFDIKYEDITLVGYESHEAIKAPIAV